MAESILTCFVDFFIALVDFELFQFFIISSIPVGLILLFKLLIGVRYD